MSKIISDFHLLDILDIVFLKNIEIVSVLLFFENVKNEKKIHNTKI